MNMKPNDTSMVQTLTAIAQTLVRVHERVAQSNPGPGLKEVAVTLEAQLHQLEPELASYAGTAFSYEFYDTTSEVVEQITRLRMTAEKKKLAAAAGLFDLFNPLVNGLRAAVYRHETLAGAMAVAVSAPPSAKPLEAARNKVNAATQRSSDASAAAERANAEGMKNLQKIQAEQQKSGGLITPALLDQSIKHTVAMLAFNTAAVLAADDAAVAITEMEDLIDQLSAAK